MDGGVKPENAAAIINAGADILVAGSAVFSNKDYAAAIRGIRGSNIIETSECNPRSSLHTLNFSNLNLSSQEAPLTIKKQTMKIPFELKDVKEPVLYRDMFPYTSVPRVVLEDRMIQTNIPKDIWITDTTFRDGQQSRPPYTPKQIVDIFDFMHRMSGPNGVIRQTEFFLYSEKDREAVRLCMERGYRFPEITGWIRANKNDFKLVKEMGLKETGILTSCSDYHIFLKLNMSRKDALKQYLDIVATALEQGIIAALPSRRHHAGRFLRFRHPLCAGADEALGSVEGPDQDPGLRHHGLRLPLPRHGAAARRSGNFLRPYPRRRRAVGAA